MERARASQRLTKDDDGCKFPDYCGCEICDEYVDIGGEGEEDLFIYGLSMWEFMAIDLGINYICV